MLPDSFFKQVGDFTLELEVYPKFLYFGNKFLYFYFKYRKGKWKRRKTSWESSSKLNSRSRLFKKSFKKW